MHYIIGDIHGHYRTLKKLLKEIKFDQNQDILHVVGDLINGDTKNVEVIELISDLGEAAVTILGNHDLSALAVYYGARSKSSSSTIGDLLESPKADQYFHWIRHQKMANQLPNGSLICHAGISSSWDFREAMMWAKTVESELRGENPSHFLAKMFEPTPVKFELCQTEVHKKVYAVNALTRQRVVERNGALDFDFKETLNDLPPHLMPWFSYRNSVRPNSTNEGHIYFGHWAALGYHKDLCATCLDSGVRWGGPLTALRLEDGKIFQAKA